MLYFPQGLPLRFGSPLSLGEFLLPTVNYFSFQDPPEKIMASFMCLVFVLISICKPTGSDIPNGILVSCGPHTCCFFSYNWKIKDAEAPFQALQVDDPLSKVRPFFFFHDQLCQMLVHFSSKSMDTKNPRVENISWFSPSTGAKPQVFGKTNKQKPNNNTAIIVIFFQNNNECELAYSFLTKNTILW